MTPDGVRELAQHGVSVLVEAGAGGELRSPDDDYAAAGAEIVATVAELVDTGRPRSARSRSPSPRSIAAYRPGLVLFTYLHLAAYPEVADGTARRRGHRRRLRDRADSTTARCRCSRR